MSSTTSAGTAAVSLPVMPRLQRKFLHEYLQKHWCLKTTGVDPEPHRFVQVLLKQSHPLIPFDLPLSKAISM